MSFDCEMVEINKSFNGLAKITVVNEHGEVIIDTFCKPKGEITDFRYDITGICASDLQNAINYDELRKNIIKLFKGRIIIGHGIENDFCVLDYEHPKSLIRDSSKTKIFQNKINQPHSLKYLTEKYFGKIIQTEVHCSIEDARSALCIYKLFEKEVEKDVMAKNHKLIRKKVIEDSKKMKSLFGI